MRLQTGRPLPRINRFRIGFCGDRSRLLVTSLVTTNKYDILVLRGLGGISNALTIPSA